MFKIAAVAILLAAHLTPPAHAEPCVPLTPSRIGSLPALALAGAGASSRRCALPAVRAQATSDGAALLGAGAGALRSRAIDLGTLGGPYSSARAVNDHGVVAGESVLPDFSQRAFVWHNGVMRDLGTLGGEFSGATGINNSGHVVGYSGTPAGEIHAFVGRVGGGTLVDIGTLGGTFSYATAINDFGHVVGGSTTAGDAELHAFFWAAGVGMIDMGTLGGGFSFARAINARRQAAGTSNNADFEQHAVRWQPLRGLVDLGAPSGFTIAEAAGINFSGAIAGFANQAVHNPRAFVWRLGTWTDLGASFPDAQTEATGINNDEDVVGSAYFTTADGGTTGKALVWNRRGVATDLGALIGADSSFGHAINSQGHVVGMAQLSGSSEYHAFLLLR